MLQFQSLVYEIKVIIFEYVPIAERIRAERVCKDWKALVVYVIPKQNALVLQAPGAHGKPEITEKERRECDNPKHFIPKNSFVKNQVRTVEDVISIIRRLPALKVFAWDPDFSIPPSKYLDDINHNEEMLSSGVDIEFHISLAWLQETLFKIHEGYLNVYVKVGKALRNYCPGLEHVFLWSKSPGTKLEAQCELRLYQEIDNDKIRCVSYATSWDIYKPVFSNLEFAQLSVNENSSKESIKSIMRKGMKRLLVVRESRDDDIRDVVDAFEEAPSSLKFGELRLHELCDKYVDPGYLDGVVDYINTQNKTIERFVITRHAFT